MAAFDPISWDSPRVHIGSNRVFSNWNVTVSGRENSAIALQFHWGPFAAIDRPTPLLGKISHEQEQRGPA